MSVSVILLVLGPNTSTSPWFDYTRMMIILLGICLLAVVAMRIILPRLTGLRAPTSNHIQVFARCPLEPHKTLYVVKAGRTMVLLGTSAQSVQFLASVNADDF
jgi:flagellar biogenesis protein FliO